MQTKNTESTQNGDIGTVVRIFDRENEDDPTQTDTIMEIDFSGMRVEYTKEDAQNLTLAYCCTVHKSQGAEYQMVIMVVSTIMNNFCSEICFTLASPELNRKFASLAISSALVLLLPSL